MRCKCCNKPMKNISRNYNLEETGYVEDMCNVCIIKSKDVTTRFVDHQFFDLTENFNRAKQKEFKYYD